MFGEKRQFYFNGKLYTWPITVEHAIDGEEEGGHITDNIKDHSVAYLSYVNAAIALMNDPMFKYSDKIKMEADLNLFQYVADSGNDKKQNIYLFQRYISWKNETTSWTFDSGNMGQYQSFLDYLDHSGVGYTITNGSRNVNYEKEDGTVSYEVKTTTITIN